MTSEQAKQALKRGWKVKCVEWSSNEYVKEEKRIVDEMGILQDSIFENFKDYEWELVNDK